MGQINQVSVGGLGVLTLGDFVHMALRSTVQFGNADTATLNFFQNGVGDTMQGTASTALGAYDTNVPDKGRLPPGWQGLIFFQSIVLPSTVALADVQDLQSKLLFKLILGSTDKASDDGPLHRYPAGGGIYGETTANATTFVNNGFPAGGARTPYAIPHNIVESIPFRVEASIASALSLTGNVNVANFLEGVYRKPVS